ncbi:kielin/chordin-like protein [Ciona intestinalis]
MIECVSSKTATTGVRTATSQWLLLLAFALVVQNTLGGIVRRSTEDDSYLPGLMDVNLDVGTDIEANRDPGNHHHRHRNRHHGPGNFTNVRVGHQHSEAERIAGVSFAEMCESGQMDDQDSTTWSNVQCQNCSCEASVVVCRPNVCPNLPCGQPVTVQGLCCPVCPDKVCQAADGRRFTEGAEWYLDDCTYCECKQGRALCSVEDCEYKSCENPVKVPGECCPICADASCHADSGRNLSAGAVWKEGLCTHCYCRTGDQACAREKCPQINCTHPYRRPNECCYTCQDAVECIVSTWGAWGECPIQECGGGKRRRYRGVVIPPRNGGAFCPHMSEAQECPRQPCSDIPVCPTTEWGSWGHCTATCGKGRRLRMRERAKVTRETMTSLIDCTQTHMQETMLCYTGTCNLSPILLDSARLEQEERCPGVYWSEWGPCSKSCGRGTRLRNQVLRNSSESIEGACRLLRELKECHGRNCTGTVDSPINCKVTHWSPWTVCSATCGETAAKSRHRTIIRHPSPGGRACPHLTVSKKCKLDPCLTIRSLIRTQPSPHACVSDDGLTHYAENERWTPEECKTCVCTNSVKVCSDVFCSKPQCEHPVKYPGFCCMFCE